MFCWCFCDVDQNILLLFVGEKVKNKGNNIPEQVKNECMHPKIGLSFVRSLLVPSVSDVMSHDD